MERRQLTLFGTLFVLVVAALAAIYFLFIRADFVPLFQDIREQEAAEIVTELERLGIDYRLADGGNSILVAEDAIEEARIGIAGTDIALGGVVGFELFNESDMGLTEFAQQVNYQRALQGELARTIMMMDGIAFARVHISLPERALFRADEIGPKAAVSVQPQPGAVIGEARVRGIQRLVASAVNEMDADDVSVLDQNGALVSPDLVRVTQSDGATDEKSALEAYFRARAETAAARFLPGADFEVRVNAVSLSPASREPAAEGEEEAGASAGASRDFVLNIALRTEFELAAGDRDAIGRAISDAVDLNTRNGDVIRFEVADLSAPMATSPRTELPRPAASAPVNSLPSADTAPLAWIEDIAFSRWALLLVLLVAILAIPLWRRRSHMSEEERQDFADQLESLLSQREERPNA